LFIDQLESLRERSIVQPTRTQTHTKEEKKKKKKNLVKKKKKNAYLALVVSFDKDSNEF
jgi:uncharacterized protein YueI